MQIFIINRDRIQSNIDSIPVNVYFTDLSSRFLMINRMYENRLRMNGGELLYKSPYEIFPPEIVSRCYMQNLEVIERGGPISFDETISFYSGGTMAMYTTKFPVMDELGNAYAIGGISTNAQEQECEESERERIVNELSDMLSSYKISNPVVPICSSCKSVRDDNGHWKHIDVNVCSYSRIEFSHGLCPECSRKYYPQYF